MASTDAVKMAVRVEARPRSTLDAFAVEHGLTMVVCERSGEWGFPEGHPRRWFAHFERAEQKGDGVLIGVSGDGPTPEAAIADYGRRISERRLVIDAMRDTRREIEVPVITPTAEV